ncbi:hypothetical protein F5X99DRAFT_425001 [Biscogniauxia marginata]|nr:hypothetical protein F5X99DRAFT_425001 [Biscogniauxia marginata]
MAIPMGLSRVKVMLGTVGSSLRITYNRLSKTDYKFVHTYSNDELIDEAKLHECSHCDSSRKAVTSRPRGGASAYLIYSGWASSGFLTFILIWLSWIDNLFPLIDSTRNGSIRWPSPYRGPPSREVDRAWEEISMYIALTDKEFLKIGKSPETAAKNAPESGGGYFLQPEFSHQNLLRKASHFKYDYYKLHDLDFRDKDETFKVHFDHCVEMLRQFVMFHADVGLVTF